MERGHDRKMIKLQILRARKHFRKDLLERGKTKAYMNKLMFNIT